MNNWRRFVVPLICGIAAICPIALLHLNNWFYHLIGNRYPSRFLGLICFSTAMCCCGWVSMTRKEDRERRAFQLFSLGLWGSLGISTVEVWYHLTDNRIPPTGWHIPDATLKSRYKPNLQWEGWFLGDQTRWDTREKRFVQFRLNRDGFRNETDLQAADIVCIGDSFTETGTAGNRTYPAVLSELTGCTVANLGVGTYSGQQELEVLRRFALPLQPSILIWQIFEGNDLREAVAYENWKHGKTPSRSTFSEVRFRLRFSLRQVLNRSIVLKTLRRLFMPSRMQFSYEPAGSADQVAQHPGWRLLEAALVEGVQLAKANQIRTILLFLPCKASLYKPNVQRPGMLNLLQQFARNQGVDCIDMWEIYRRRYLKFGEVYYWHNDSHISDDGCRLVAQILARQIPGEYTSVCNTPMDGAP